MALPRLVPERPERDRYLEETEILDWQTPRVAECAREVARTARRAAEEAGGDGQAGTRAEIGALFRFVRDEIVHSADGGAGVLTWRASQVLREGEGLCFAKSHLLAALLRARGVPAGFGYQRLRRDPPERGFVLHGFVGIFLVEEDRWVAVDPRGPGTGLDLERGCVAHPLEVDPDPETGEGTYETLLARPHPGVLEVLSRAPDLERAWKALPGEL